MIALSSTRIFSIFAVLGLCLATVATAADGDEAQYAALREKIEKKIGPEKLQDLDKYNATVFKNWNEWDGDMGSAQRYFRRGRVGTEEEKKFLIDAHMNIKWFQGYLLQAEFHKDPWWRKFTVAFFDMVKASGAIEKPLKELKQCDQIIGYDEPTGPVTSADELFAEYAKRRPKIDQYTDQIFKNYQIPKHYLEGIRHDATINVWQNLGIVYFMDLGQDYPRYETLSKVLGKFD